MISVEQAQELCLALVRPLDTESVPLIEASGRVLAAPARSSRAQPPFPASAMDGYAVRMADARPGATLTVVGEAAAGHTWHGTIGPGQALRIFTGAPVPTGADRVIIQEDTERAGDKITLKGNLDSGSHIRAMGADFQSGFTLDGPRRLRPVELALLAAMNVAKVTASRKPVVAILSTGDELVLPGATPRPDQIIASNIFALHALVEEAGGNARILPIAKDTEADLRRIFALAMSSDLIVTVGGASVGDHDLVGRVAQDLGLARAFHRIAMRPGKPLMAGRFEGPAFLGLPGNPVSAIVCGLLFLLPMLRRMQGLQDCLPVLHQAELTCDLPANGVRAHYMRARLDQGPSGPRITPFERQDSALLGVLHDAQALLVRPVDDPPRQAGERVEFLQL